MKEFVSLLSDELSEGLRPFGIRSKGCLELFNLIPDGYRLKNYDAIVSLNENRSWGAEALLTPTATTRNITIVVKDYVSEADIEGAMVYIDGSLAGTADINGEVQVTDIAIGGHALKITKAGYLDSDADYLLNDYFVVT